MTSIKIPSDASINVQAAFRDVEDAVRGLSKRVDDLKPGVKPSDLDDLRREVIRLTRKPSYQTWAEVFGSMMGKDTILNTQIGQANIAHDSLLMLWPGGDSVAPSGWTKSGSGATVARTGFGGTGYEASAPADTTKMKYGRFAAKLTPGAATAKLTKTFIPTASFPLGLQGRRVSVLVRGVSSTAGQSSLIVDDGVLTTRGGASGNDSFHTGSGLEEKLFATHTFSSSATKLDLVLESNLIGEGPFYFSNITIVLSDVVPSDWFPEHVEVLSLGQHLVGNAVVANLINEFRHDFEFPSYLWKTRLKCKTAPVTTAITVRPAKAGSSYPYSTNPTIAAAATAGNKVVEGTYANRCFAQGDIFTWDITTIGTGTVGDEVNALFLFIVSMPLFDLLKY